MADLDRLVIHIDVAKIWRKVHTRDSGLPVLVNVLTTTCLKPAKKELEPRGGTAIWVMGRQDPFYIRETVEEFEAALLREDSAGAAVTPPLHSYRVQHDNE